MNTRMEYGVNDCDAGDNPFDSNFGTQEEAEQAGIDYLKATPLCNSVLIFELKLRKNQIVRNEIIRTIDRSELPTATPTEIDRAGQCRCSECSDVVASITGCPDGAELCEACFDKGEH